MLMLVSSSLVFRDVSLAVWTRSMWDGVVMMLVVFVLEQSVTLEARYPMMAISAKLNRDSGVLWYGTSLVRKADDASSCQSVL